MKKYLFILFTIMMKHKLFFLLALLLMCNGLRAQNAVVIHQTNGQTVNYFFIQKPKVTYAGDCLIMSTTENTVQYSLRSLRKIEFADVDDSAIIDGIQPSTAVKGLMFSFRQSTINVANAEAGSCVLLYDAEGKCLAEQSVDEQGRCTLSTEALPRGVYVIQIGQTSYKIVK